MVFVCCHKYQLPWIQRLLNFDLVFSFSIGVGELLGLPLFVKKAGVATVDDEPSNWQGMHWSLQCTWPPSQLLPPRPTGPTGPFPGSVFNVYLVHVAAYLNATRLPLLSHLITLAFVCVCIWEVTLQLTTFYTMLHTVSSIPSFFHHKW